MSNHTEVSERPAALGKRLRKAGFLVIIAAVFVVMILTVLVREILSTAFSDDEPPQLTPVIVAEVHELQFADTITAVGTARANESVAVTSKISDTISRVAFDSGDLVSGGQVLAELVDTEEAAGLEAARATLDEARRERDRVTALVERGVASAQNYDEAVSNFQRASAQVNAIEARMDNRIIRAPFDGVVGLRNISAGELIDTGTVIATLNDVSVIKLDFNVPERFLSSVSSGQLVHARSSAWPDQVFSGVITHIDNQVDAASRTVTVRAEIPNDPGRLMPGMLLRIEVRRNERQQPGIPEAALMRLADQAYVFLVVPGDDQERGDAVIRRQDVRPGLRYSGYVEILEGLKPGDKVVADGTHRIREGSAVRVSGERDAPPPQLLIPRPAPVLVQESPDDSEAPGNGVSDDDAGGGDAPARSIPLITPRESSPETVEARSGDDTAPAEQSDDTDSTAADGDNAEPDGDMGTSGNSADDPETSTNGTPEDEQQ